MIPRLYPENETAFTSNGIGILGQAVDCTVSEVLDSSFELELRYPVEGVLFSELRHRRIILSKPDPYAEPEPFRIYRIAKSMGGTVTVYARHLAYDLLGVVVEPFTAQTLSEALQALGDHAVGGCPFSFYADKAAEGLLEVKKPQPIWSLLPTIMELYGCEIRFSGRQIRFLAHRGTDRGVVIRYGVGLTDLRQDENCAECYTGVYPYWADREGTLIHLPERAVQASGNWSHSKLLPLDCSGAFEEAPTEEQLREAAAQYITDHRIGIPATSWQVQFVQLSKTVEYRDRGLLEQIQNGDTVAVYYINIGVTAQARAVETYYKPLLDRYESITLGDPVTDIATTVAAQAKELKTKADFQHVQLAIDQQMTHEQIFSKLTDGGKIQGIYETDGRWYINAQIAKIVNLMAETVTAGKLRSVDEKTWFDLDSGTFRSTGSDISVDISGGTMKVYNADEKKIFEVIATEAGGDLRLYDETGAEALQLNALGGHLSVSCLDPTSGRRIGGKLGLIDVAGSKVLGLYTED